MNSLNVPAELWIRIAHFIPPLEIQNLYAVNSTFFELAMDQRYKQISFAYLTKSMVKLLMRLKDPLVSKRVRVLHLHPHFVKDVLEKESLCIAEERSKKLRWKMSELAKTIMSDPHATMKLLKGGRSRSLSLKTTQDLVKVLLDVLGGLPAVTEYHIMWCGQGLASIGDTPVPFLAAPLRSSLRKLSLDVSLEKMYSLFCTRETPIFLDHLEDLELHLRADAFTSSLDEKVELEPVDFEPIKQLIGTHRHTLRTLSLSSRDPIDFSPLFFCLPCIPWLQNLILSIPVHAPHFGDPSALAFFLNSHSVTLRSLTLRGTEMSSHGFLANEYMFEKWLTEVADSVDIPRLQRFEMTSGLIPLGASLAFLARFAQSLVSFTLTGRALCHRSISDIVSTFYPLASPYTAGGEPVEEEIWGVCRDVRGLSLQRLPRQRRRLNLRRLRLGTVTVSPELFDMLAERMPDLERLELLVKDVVPAQGDCAVFCKSIHVGGPPELEEQDESQICEFLSEMEKRRYDGWALERLGLMRSTYPYHLEPESEYWKVFSRCIPGLREVF